MVIILFYYLFTRLYGISGHMNEYSDYDEGTYLMIARLINHGYLPYRDIFAVHPPLFYYLLALWLRIFGDNYVVGRLFSVFLGFLSLIIAYYVGKEIRDWKLGVSFAGLLAMDPLLIHVNPLVFHETSIEFFTLLSLYYFVKYAKCHELKHAYISLFWAALGSTSKFTIIPYLIALYLVIILSLNEKTWIYLKGASNVLLNRMQVFTGIIAYLSFILVCVSVLMVYPSKSVRNIMIVPGIHAITLKTHLIPILILMTFWGLLTVYLFKISYLRKLFEILTALLKNLKVELKLALSVLIPKVLIEGFFGLGISREYISQTYMTQGGRFLPLLNLFYYIGGKFGDIHASKLEFLVYDVPLMILLIFIFLGAVERLKSENSDIRESLKILFLANFFIYFFISPTIANPRFLYSMTLVLYLVMLDFLLGLNVSKKKAIAGVIISLVFLSAVDFGMVYWFPKGKLKLAWAPKTKELRDDLGNYIRLKGIDNESYYSINPMNAYYLNLNIEPYYLDTFGLIILNNRPAEQLLKEQAGMMIITSSWLYGAWISSWLSEELSNIVNYLHEAYSLDYADSYASGELVELYKPGNISRQLSFSSYRGKIVIWLNGTKLAYVTLKNGGQEFNYRTKIRYLEEGTYSVVQYSNNESIEFSVKLVNNTISFEMPDESILNIEFARDFVGFYKINGEVKQFELRKKEIADTSAIFLDGHELEIQGKNLLVEKISERTISIIGRKIKLKNKV